MCSLSERPVRPYLVAPDGSIVWVAGPEDYQYVWEEMKDNLPDDWD
jgi:hypothetical protein